MKTRSWNSPLRLIPLGMLVSNIGNGMYLLAVSVLMYQKYGGPSVFAWLLILQSIAVVVTQILASVGADAGHSKSLAMTAEFVRGGLVIAGAVAAHFGQLGVLFGVGLLLAFVQPFYRTPIFAIGPLIAQGDQLARYNARTATYQQIGQFIGAGLAGIIMEISVTLPLYLNGLSYIFSGLMVGLSFIPGATARFHMRAVSETFRPASVSRLWLSGIVELWKTKTTLYLTILCAADFLVISWLNTMYAPLLRQLGVGKIWVSWWDTAFAVGALVGANLVGHISAIRRSFRWLPVILIVEGFTLLGVGRWGGVGTVIVMALIGIINSVSVSLFTYFIQISTRVEMAGRSSGVRQLSIAAVNVVALPGLSHMATGSVISSGKGLFLLLVIVGSIALLVLRGRQTGLETTQGLRDVA